MIDKRIANSLTPIQEGEFNLFDWKFWKHFYLPPAGWLLENGGASPRGSEFGNPLSLTAKELQHKNSILTISELAHPRLFR